MELRGCVGDGDKGRSSRLMVIGSVELDLKVGALRLVGGASVENRCREGAWVDEGYEDEATGRSSIGLAGQRKWFVANERRGTESSLSG